MPRRDAMLDWLRSGGEEPRAVRRSRGIVAVSEQLRGVLAKTARDRALGRFTVEARVDRYEALHALPTPTPLLREPDSVTEWPP